MNPRQNQHPYPPQQSPPPPGLTGSQKRRKVITGVIGTMITLVSLPCVALTFGQLLSGASNHNIGGMLFWAVFFTIGSLIGGSMLFRSLRKPKEVHENRDWERVILELARRQSGVLSATNVAVETNLSIEESKKMLDAMVEKNAARIHIGDAGYVTYEFPSFSTEQSAPPSQNQQDLASFDQRLSESMGSNVSFDFEQKQQQQQQQQQHLNAAPHHFQNKK